MGKVYLIGAGPGDPELITLKGLKILQIADVILYDRLISKDLLNYARRDAEKIYVGKELGEANLQNWINKTLVEKAKEYNIVVRLKGGDPYVFGRGEEECYYVKSQGLECEVIPGISSAIAVPAYAGIPVTSRYFSSGFTVISGNRAEGKEIDEDYIPKKGTLVVLMGLSNINKLQNILLKTRQKDTPVAIIQNGTLNSQKVYVTTLENLSFTVEKNNIKSPAIIVVGEVIKLRESLWKLS
ncbi:uroporphyrinogen-III C-methyltransferase [Acidianus sulfidivorans JP7]|uniref:uroporphyrinogen-III C-methyltransferase n=1 Tax=Acidianus sulfidivorans TaxID=312539 RepID=UPI0014436A25|nr:uroporphyrinogen-III C-methyltransferase [Acidianus sulfidivorans]AWR96614.2 uroporphyrinogen-III C-methyltransferase [Acidianus sulfidivorans JP7]